jgi:EAL domain-containing protein (putative c-di-GMP-specific phosphodiesterase class I)
MPLRHAACGQQRLWREAGCPLLPVAVNVSVHQFAIMDLAAIVNAALERHQLPPALLGIEITESALMEQPERAIEVLRPLQQLGIEIHLDDFGTGFSNLSYLTRLPLDVLKIDAAFVGALGTSPAADVLVDSVIALAHGLGLDVVAEGVETAAQLAFLESHGCDHVQGFHIGRPMPAAKFERLLRTAS